MGVPARDIEQILHAVRTRLHLTPGAAGGGPATIGPHTHSADAVAFTPAGSIAADDVQEGMQELDTEKLARDGSQTMLGDLDMNHNDITNALSAEIETHVDFASTAPTPAVGRVAWSTLERSLVYYVESGS